MKWVCVIGLPRSGTSFLTGRLHAAGLPMWLETPGTIHNEDPVMRAAVDHLPESTTLVADWRDLAVRRGVFPCGWKHPRMVRHREVATSVFPPEESRYILCQRSRERRVRSLMSLTGWTRGTCERDVAEDDGHLLGWVEMGECLHVFNYDGDIGAEERNLREFLGVELDLADHWAPRAK